MVNHEQFTPDVEALQSLLKHLDQTLSGISAAEEGYRALFPELFRLDQTLQALLGRMGSPDGLESAPAPADPGFGNLERTDIKETQEALEVERARLAAILESLPVGVWITDPQGRIIGKNEQADRIWAGEVPLLESIKVYPEYTAWWPESGQPVQPDEYPVARTVRSGLPVDPVEMGIRRFDGSEGTVLVSAAPIRDREGRLVGVVGINLDITDLRWAKDEATQNLTRLEVQRHLLQEREQERMQLARDLHDGPVQELIMANFTLADLSHQVQDPAALENVASLKMNIHMLIDELRSFASDLRPPVLVNFGLARAINSLAQTFQEKNPDIDVHVDLDRERDPLGEPVELALYRICQEALVNIVRHAQADQIWIRFQNTPDEVLLEVEDNGQGMTLPRQWLDLVKEGHLGLVGMVERAEAIGGKVDFYGSPGKGSHICVSVPRKPQG